MSDKENARGFLYNRKGIESSLSDLLRGAEFGSSRYNALCDFIALETAKIDEKEEREVLEGIRISDTEEILSVQYRNVLQQMTKVFLIEETVRIHSNNMLGYEAFFSLLLNHFSLLQQDELKGLEGSITVDKDRWWHIATSNAIGDFSHLKWEVAAGKFVDSKKQS